MNFPEKYKCSVHGLEGNANCLECWKKLHELVKDSESYLTGDTGPNGQEEHPSSDTEQPGIPTAS